MTLYYYALNLHCFSVKLKIIPIYKPIIILRLYKLLSLEIRKNLFEKNTLTN